MCEYFIDDDVWEYCCVFEGVCEVVFVMFDV